MKRIKNVKNKVLVLIGACIPLLNMTTVHAEGLNTGELRNWVSSYLDPLESTLLWVIPVTLLLQNQSIYCCLCSLFLKR